MEMYVSLELNFDVWMLGNGEDMFDFKWLPWCWGSWSTWVHLEAFKLLIGRSCTSHDKEPRRSYEHKRGPSLKNIKYSSDFFDRSFKLQGNERSEKKLHWEGITKDILTKVFVEIILDLCAVVRNNVVIPCILFPNGNILKNYSVISQPR